MVNSFTTVARQTPQQREEMDAFASSAVLAPNMAEVEKVMDVQGYAHQKNLMHGLMAAQNIHTYRKYTARDPSVFDRDEMLKRRAAKQAKALKKRK